MADDSGIRLHQALAQGKALPSGDFGVDKLSSHAAGGPVKDTQKELGDHERGASKPINGNQANPDHGPR